MPDCLLTMALAIIGPGILAPADPLVLERVEVRRVQHGWGLDEFAGVGVVRIAVEECKYIGWDGLIVAGEYSYPARVVDCQKRDEKPRMDSLGIVADVSAAEVGDRQAYVIRWKATNATP